MPLLLFYPHCDVILSEAKDLSLAMDLLLRTSHIALDLLEYLISLSTCSSHHLQHHHRHIIGEVILAVGEDLDTNDFADLLG